jgi:hypothetical protein
MYLPATEGCTYCKCVHSNEQGRYGAIEYITSIIFKTIIYIYFAKNILYQQPPHTIKSHNTNTTTIEKVCASNQFIFPLDPLSPSQRL